MMDNFFLFKVFRKIDILCSFVILVNSFCVLFIVKVVLSHFW